MKDSIDRDHFLETVPEETDSGLIKITEELLLDTKAQRPAEKAITVPIAELSVLGTGVSSLIPVFHTITQTVSSGGTGLYRLANAGIGDTLKSAGNGIYYGALKTVDGGSRMAKFQEVGPMTSTAKTILPPDPATMMMAVALFSIEKRLGKIEETQKQILSFLEIEKESEIEADVETLVDIMKKYKLIWDNPQFIASHHKTVLDIRRTARKNMNAYQKKVQAVLGAKQILTAQANVRSKLRELQKHFQYYRLSLYAFSLASLLEIMLSGNFQEEYILETKKEIGELAETYRELFAQCSAYLEKMGRSAIDIHVRKGLGTVSRTIGKWIESIPVVSNGPVDEFLQSGGEHLQETAAETEQKAVKEFASIGDPGTGIFEKQMDEFIRIYHRTTQICFDDENIYLLAE